MEEYFSGSKNDRYTTLYQFLPKINKLFMNLVHYKLTESIKVLFASDLGVVDFHPSGDCAVIYISAAEMIEGVLYKKRLAGLKSVSKIYPSIYMCHCLNCVFLLRSKGSVRSLWLKELTFLYSSFPLFSSLQFWSLNWTSFL